MQFFSAHQTLNENKRRFSSPIDSSSSSKTSNRSDPTAKRPTQKCDPYGLSGQSLSYRECSNMLSTLEDGWKFTNSKHELLSERDESPTFLEKQFHHETFYAASRFLSQVSLLSTNINHYPQLSMERVLVDDVNKFYNSKKAASTEKDGKRIKGWIFVSTIRCSTYRPAMKKKEVNEDGSNTSTADKGLTYHDFHLAMSIDVEANREELGQLLLKKVDDVNDCSD